MNGNQLMHRFLIKFYRKLPVFFYDGLSIPVAWYVAYWLRYNLESLPDQLFTTRGIVAFCILLGVQVSSYCYCQVYRGVWQFVSLNDLMRIVTSVMYTLIAVIPLFYLTATIQLIPRSVLPLYAMIYCATLSLGRIASRTLRDRFGHRQQDAPTRVLIIGAGRSGEGLIRDLKRTMLYVPVGILDDHPDKQGLEIHGVRVEGTLAALPQLVKKLNVHLVLIAIPSARASLIRRIVDDCELVKVPFRTLPSLADLVDGRVEVSALREVNLEDLLGRAEVQLDWKQMHAAIVGKRVLVTGGGGSIGAELCRQILKHAPSHLMLIENAEYQLYQIEQELKALQTETVIQFVLVSITDQPGITHWFTQYRPEIVFHAAAYKHVPLLEALIRPAVLNNILGTKVVAEASVAVGVQKFVLISTDKAVNPSNIMGATKRVAELYCQNLNEKVETRFLTVRFGNVLGSAGSVVPLFRKQLKMGGPLTVTHPEIERYFMTIPEACQLILQAMLHGNGGEIFVLDMGEPVKIRYLAEQMIKLSRQDAEIIYTGLRPGEKLYEELFHLEEPLIQTEHHKLLKASFRSCSWEQLTQVMTLLAQACDDYDEAELQFLLKTLVPELHASSDVAASASI